MQVGVWAMVAKEFRELRRDRRTVALMIVLPVVLLVVSGGPARGVRGGVVPAGRGQCALLAIALLTVLGENGVPRADGLWGPVHAALHDLCDIYDKSSWEPLHAADRYYDLETGMPFAGLLALLAEFGAVAGDRGKPVITPLGRWAAGHLAAGLPGLADPSLSAGEMIAEAARFGDEEQRGHVAWGWLKATLLSSTGPRTTPQNRSRSTWPRSTAS